MSRKSTSIRPSRRLINAALLTLIPLASASSAAAVPPPTDLICPTETDCYPRHFIPTHEFQVIREGQEIPPGLHVQMDIYTGVKQAKLMDPEDDSKTDELVEIDQDGGVQKKLSGSALAVVPGEGEGKVFEDGPIDGFYLPSLSPEVKNFPQTNDFFTALAKIAEGDATGDTALDAALENLSEISHDHFYGDLLTQDYDITAALLCFAFDSDVAGSSPSGYPRAHIAANALADALQNNHKTLANVMYHWPRLHEHACMPGRTAVGRRVLEGALAPSALSPVNSIAKEQAAHVRSKGRLLEGLLQSPVFRSSFLASNGMQHILEVLVRPESVLEKAQKRLSQVVIDIFLDEDMGAVRGEWPRFPALKGKEGKVVCGGGEIKEVCWDFIIEGLAKKGGRNHWSWELAERLRGERSKGTKQEL